MKPSLLTSLRSIGCRHNAYGLRRVHRRGIFLIILTIVATEIFFLVHAISIHVKELEIESLFVDDLSPMVDLVMMTLRRREPPLFRPLWQRTLDSRCTPR